MKYSLLILVLLISSFQIGRSQQEQRSVTKIGYHLAEPWSKLLPSSYHKSIPSLTLESERQLLPMLSLGAELGGMKLDASGIDRSQGNFLENSVYVFHGSVKGIVHLCIARTFEMYGSVGVGYVKAVDTTYDDRVHATGALRRLTGLTKSAALGVNLYLSEHFGLFGEAGIRHSRGILKVGMVFRR